MTVSKPKKMEIIDIGVNSERLSMNIKNEGRNDAIEECDAYYEQEIKSQKAIAFREGWEMLEQKLSVDNIERVLNILFKESGDKQVKSVEEKGRWACDFETLNSKTIAEAIHKLVGEDNV